MNVLRAKLYEMELERRAAEIAAKAGEHLPIPWQETERLVSGWDTGTPTRVYDKMGIYR